MKDPFVSIIIITRNRPFLLQHCIEHVLRQPYLHKEIIVIDSSSNDESEKVVAGFPEVISVRQRGKRNNMPQARNEGIATSSGDILAFIDDDAMVQPGWLESLVNGYRDERVGAVGGRVIDRPVPYCDQISGSPQLVVLPWGRVIMKGNGLLSTDQIEVDHLHGCNMSFRREALEQVGGFDTNYTLTNLREETDLCVRMKKAGWRIVFRPTMTVMHFSFRSGYDPYFLERLLPQFSNGRNDMYFTIKNFGLKPLTLVGQLMVIGLGCGRAAYFTFLFITGMMVQIAGRLVGLGMGILWLMSSRRRAASTPKITRRTHSAKEQLSSSEITPSKSLT